MSVLLRVETKGPAPSNGAPGTIAGLRPGRDPIGGGR